MVNGEAKSESKPSWALTHHCILPPQDWYPLSLQITILQYFQVQSPLKFPRKEVCTKRPLTLAGALHGTIPPCTLASPSSHCRLRTMPWWTWRLSCQQDLDLGGRLVGASPQDSPGSSNIHSLCRCIQQQAWNRDVVNPIKISPIMWHTLLEQNKGFGSVGPNQVGLCGVSHFRFKSLLNPLLRLVVNNIFISVCRDDRQPSSRAGPVASAWLLLEAGSIDERQKSHHPSVSWLARRKAEWQTCFQSAWPMQGNGAIWTEKGFRLLLCAREGGWRKKLI